MSEPISEFQDEFRFLSNFYPSQLLYQGLMWETVEAAFQAAKTFDWDQREEIRNASSAGQAKRLGRKVKLREDWDAVKVDIMRELLYHKFKCNDHLLQRLLATGDRSLIEGNTWGDVFWGVNSKTGEGENNLGKLLMEVRDKFRKRL